MITNNIIFVSAWDDVLKEMCMPVHSGSKVHYYNGQWGIEDGDTL